MKILSRCQRDACTSTGTTCRRASIGAEVSAVTGHVYVRIGPFGVSVAVKILVRGKSVDDGSLRAGADRADLRSGVILVVEALVGGLGVEIDGAGAGGARRRALI